MANIARPLDATERASSVAHTRYYTLALLTPSYGLNLLDRTIFNVLIEWINKDIPALKPHAPPACWLLLRADVFAARPIGRLATATPGLAESMPQGHIWRARCQRAQS
jgi:hypothetical protein